MMEENEIISMFISYFPSVELYSPACSLEEAEGIFQGSCSVMSEAS